jgi:hypothetical protein
VDGRCWRRLSRQKGVSTRSHESPYAIIDPTPSGAVSLSLVRASIPPSRKVLLLSLHSLTHCVCLRELTSANYCVCARVGASLGWT